MKIIPETNILLDSLLVLLLPGFVALKVRELFFPKTPSRKSDTLDKIATYFLLTMLVYLLAYWPIVWLAGSLSNNIYLSAFLATVAAVIVGIISSMIQSYYETSDSRVPMWVRSKMEDFIPAQHSLWLKLFHTDKRLEEKKKQCKLYIKVLIFMKNSDRFIGELYSYPVEEGPNDTLNFVLKGVTAYEHHGKNKELKTTKYSPEYGLIINQNEVQRLVYDYVTQSEFVEES